MRPYHAITLTASRLNIPYTYYTLKNNNFERLCLPGSLHLKLSSCLESKKAVGKSKSLEECGRGVPWSITMANLW